MRRSSRELSSSRESESLFPQSGAVKWRPPSSPEAPFLERVARPKGKKHHPSSSIPCTNTSESGSGLYQTPGRPPKLSLSLYQPPHPCRGNGDIDGHNTINLCSRHNKSCSPVVLRFQPAFPPSPAGLYASAGAEDARKRESSQARSRPNCWANKEGRKKTLQFKISCLIDLTHFHSLMLVNTPSFPPI